jgi:hypothetical protein
VRDELGSRAVYLIEFAASATNLLMISTFRVHPDPLREFPTTPVKVSPMSTSAASLVSTERESDTPDSWLNRALARRHAEEGETWSSSGSRFNSAI